MIVSVVREHHWSPEQISKLSLYDEDDINGLEFWYNDVKEVHKKLEKKK